MYIANTISSIKQLEFNSEVEKSCVIRAYTYEENPTLTLTPHKKKDWKRNWWNIRWLQKRNVFWQNVIAAWIKNDQKIEISLRLRHKNHLVPLQMCFVGRDSIVCGIKSSRYFGILFSIFVSVCKSCKLCQRCILISGGRVFGWSLIVIVWIEMQECFNHSTIQLQNGKWW